MSAINGSALLLILAIIGFTIYAIHAAITDGTTQLTLEKEHTMTTDQEFEIIIRAAENYGTEYAKTHPGRNAPLSGEWSDDITTGELLAAIGADTHELTPEDRDEIFSAFENAYYAADTTDQKDDQ